ncbi:hypothetical protein [Flaviaesturariibacter aridisoli]|uniref:Uncharacterized protein n=1 Tax=Flaviaesturariibacter aridisoli TaxID=2545761 RepID=A0A4R4DV87_9BACT|nr:hypothetical protein [Flaviaesturariibacter aridisoli]TCZ67055.1 hypothetical protein E0486_16340 [Flaviaesturariibacter aridisoli]
MKKIRLLLGNPFSDPRITTLRLVLFAQNAQQALRDEFVEVAALIGDKIEKVVVTLGAIGKGAAEQVGGTLALTAFKKRLHTFMKENEDGLSVALGGRSSRGFLAFLPQGLTELYRMTHTEAPAVLQRIGQALDDHAPALPDPLRSGLEGLYDQWTQLRTSQQYLLETLDAKRNERDAERIALEMAVLKAVHLVALKYLGNEEGAERFFAEHLLKGKRRKKKEEAAAV